MEQSRTRGGLIIGAIMIAAGVLSLLGQILDVDVLGIGWPLIILALGAAFFVGMFVGGKAYAPLAIPGSIITTVGLILFFQNVTGLWETWSYAWALIPFAVGLGMVIAGFWNGQVDFRERGLRVMQVGLILFLVFGAINEFIFSIVGFSTGTGGVLWPVILLIVSVYMLASRSYHLIAHSEQRGGRDLNLFGPILLIGVSALWILVRLEMLPARQVLALLNLWPLLLIAAGFQLLLGHRFPAVGALVGVVVVATLIYFAVAGPRLGFQLTFPWGNFFSEVRDSNGRITEQVQGSGVLASETRPAIGFTRVELTAFGDADIVQGDQEGVVIEADDNLLPYITTEVRGKELKIGLKRGIGINAKQGIHYTITVRNLDQVMITGAGTVTMDSLITNDLTLNSSGFGNFKIGDLQADELDVIIGGSGTTNVAGETDRLDVEIDGFGTFNGPDLQSVDADVKISGFGKAVMWVEQQLSTNVSGFGAVSYYGEPTVTRSASGIGDVQHLGNK